MAPAESLCYKPELSFSSQEEKETVNRNRRKVEKRKKLNLIESDEEDEEECEIENVLSPGTKVCLFVPLTSMKGSSELMSV